MRSHTPRGHDGIIPFTDGESAYKCPLCDALLTPLTRISLSCYYHSLLSRITMHMFSQALGFDGYQVEHNILFRI